MSEKKKFSLFRFIIYVLVLVMMVGMSCAVYLSWQPQDLSGFDGREEIAGDADKPVVDLREKMQAAKNGLYEITITEEELNRYLASRMKLEQTGVTDEYVRVKGVYVDLKPDLMEVVIERELDYVAKDADGNESRPVSFLPITHTVAMKLKVVTEESESGGLTRRIDFPPGRFGQVPAPGQFVQLVKPSFDKLLNFFDEEKNLGYEEMAKVEIGDGFIKMDPRPNVRTAPLPK